MDELKKAQLSFLARYEKKGPPPTAAPRPTPVPPKPAPAQAPAPPKPAPAQARPEALLTDQRLLYDIINYLKEVDRAVTIEEITSGTGIDVLSNPELLESIKTNPKVGIVEGRWYSFKPTYDITNKQELWSLIAETPQGIESSELKDSYKNIVQDVRELHESGKIMVISNPERKTQVFYPNESNIKITMPQDLKDLWREIKIPDEIDLEREMKQAGLVMIPEDDDLKSKRYKKKSGKKKRKKRKVKITNVHVTDIDLSTDFTQDRLGL